MNDWYSKREWKAMPSNDSHNFLFTMHCQHHIKITKWAKDLPVSDEDATM